MKGLIFPDMPFAYADGVTVVDFHEEGFEVAPPLEWQDIPDELWAEQQLNGGIIYYKDGAFALHQLKKPTPVEASGLLEI